MTGLMANAVMLLAAGGGSGHSDGGNPLTQPDPGLMIWTLILFLMTLIVLWKFGWGMMISKLDARDSAMRGAIDEAKIEREAAEKLLAEQRQLLADARREASEMVSQAQVEAGREKTRIVQEAREEYERIVERGRRQIEQETRAALSQIRTRVAELSVDVAGKVIGRTLDEQVHRDLAEKFVADIDRV